MCRNRSRARGLPLFRSGRSRTASPNCRRRRASVWSAKACAAAGGPMSRRALYCRDLDRQDHGGRQEEHSRPASSLSSSTAIDTHGVSFTRAAKRPAENPVMEARSSVIVRLLRARRPAARADRSPARRKQTTAGMRERGNLSPDHGSERAGRVKDFK